VATPRDEDETVAKVVAGHVHPASYTSLRQAGLSPDQATEVVADAVTQQARTCPPP